jgi:hypothetical protein
MTTLSNLQTSVDELRGDRTRVLLFALDNLIWPILLVAFIVFSVLLPEIFTQYRNIEFLLYTSAGLGAIALAVGDLNARPGAGVERQRRADLPIPRGSRLGHKPDGVLAGDRGRKLAGDLVLVDDITAAGADLWEDSAKGAVNLGSGGIDLGLGEAYVQVLLAGERSNLIEFEGAFGVDEVAILVLVLLGGAKPLAGLLGLGSLVFLVVYGERSGPFVTLLALYLAIAASGLFAVAYRSGRS